MAKARAQRVFKSAATALIAAAVGAAGGSCMPRAGTPHAEYCAIMPDSVGLYAGNPVTQMGYQIGKVKAITPSERDVRVDFTVTERRPLRSDVKAIIRSTSILADRSLELVGNYEAGARLPAGGCIPTQPLVDAQEPVGSDRLGNHLRQLGQPQRVDEYRRCHPGARSFHAQQRGRYQSVADHLVGRSR